MKECKTINIEYYAKEDVEIESTFVVCLFVCVLCAKKEKENIFFGMIQANIHFEVGKSHSAVKGPNIHSLIISRVFLTDLGL